MTRRNKIIYWIATLWLALGMFSTGAVQLLRMPADVDLMNRLGFPIYLLTLLGSWKLLGVVAVLIPRFPLLKEWAYAGFFFAMSGAIFAHLASSGPLSDTLPALLLLTLTVLSWHFRPASRRITSPNQ